MIGYVYLALTLFFAAYWNIVFKYNLNQMGGGEFTSNSDLLFFYLRFFFLTPWGFSCLLSVPLCIIFWFLTLLRFDLSYVFPFLSLNFALVTILSFVVLHEPFSWQKLIGTCVIVLGVFITSRGG